MRRPFILTFLNIILLVSPLASKKLNVVTTSTDLASIAKEIGQGLVNVKSLAEGDENLHYIPARPDYIVKANRADVFLLIGADLEVGWVPLVLKNSRNPEIQPGGIGYCDVSKSIPLMEGRQGEINRQMGDVHPRGNPHYWVDPINGIKMARFIKNCFSRADTKNQKAYHKNYVSFQKKLKALTRKLLTKMKPYFGKAVVSYHSEFIYFARRFRLKVATHIEEKPGISPSPKRIQTVIRLMKEKSIKLILSTPWDQRAPVNKVSREVAGSKVLILPIQTGSAPNTGSYLKMLETCVRLIIKGLK